MKKNFNLLGILLAFISFAAFAQSNPDHSMMRMQPNAQGAVENVKAQKRDGQIIGIIIAINNNEIAAAREAMQKSNNPVVQNFAKTMNRDHSKNLQDTMRVAQANNIAPMQSDKSAKIQKKGAKELYVLHKTPEPKFDVVYINAMIKGHKMVLDIIEKKLLPNATSPALQQHLQATHDKVAQHYQMALDVKNQLH